MVKMRTEPEVRPNSDVTKTFCTMTLGRSEEQYWLVAKLLLAQSTGTRNNDGSSSCDVVHIELIPVGTALRHHEFEPVPAHIPYE